MLPKRPPHDVCHVAIFFWNFSRNFASLAYATRGPGDDRNPFSRRPPRSPLILASDASRPVSHPFSSLLPKTRPVRREQFFLAPTDYQTLPGARAHETRGAGRAPSSGGALLLRLRGQPRYRVYAPGGAQKYPLSRPGRPAPCARQSVFPGAPARIYPARRSHEEG